MKKEILGFLWNEYKIADNYYRQIPTDYNKGAVDSLRAMIEELDKDFFIGGDYED